MKYFLTLFVLSLGQGLPLRAEPELFTNVYVVPPTFMNNEGKSVGWRPSPSPEERYLPRERHTAKTILEGAGITFSKGSSAIFKADTSQLTVRNTEEQMKLVEAYIESIVAKVEKQIYVSVREVRVRGELLELSKLGNFGGPFDSPERPTDELEKARYFDSYKSFQEELARPPEEERDARRVRLAGAFTDPQFQVMIRHLEKTPEVEVDSLTSVMLRSGQPGMTRKDGKRYGFIAVLGADETTVDLDIFLPEAGKALFDEGAKLEPTVRATLPDNGTVVVEEKNVNGESRLVFVRAQLMDPAGMPINRGKQATDKKLTPTPAEMEIALPTPESELKVTLASRPEMGQISIELYTSDGKPTGKPLKPGTQIQIPDPNRPGEKIYFKAP